MYTGQLVLIGSIFLFMAIAILTFITQNLPSFEKILLWILSLTFFILLNSLLISLNIFTYKMLVEKEPFIVMALFSLLIIPSAAFLAYYNIADIKLLIKKFKE